jgi:hypothetical protein
LIAEFTALLGDTLTADQEVLVRHAAELSVRIEGRRIPDEEFVRLSNALHRTFAKLGIGKRRVREEPGASLVEYLANLSASPELAESEDAQAEPEEAP